MTPRKLVYAFADGFTDGRADMSAQLGGKGANLAEMCLMGLPVPPGFTLTTDVCTHFNAHDRAFPEGLKEQVEAALARLSEDIGMVFGDTKNPLLVSVRSGSRASMPGMMDTVLNLGLNDETVESMAAKTGDARFAWDSYRRFQQMYGDVVMGIEHDYFEDIIDDYKFENALSLDADLEADDWRDICTRFGEMMEQEAGHPFPQDAHAQLWGAIGAVFDSWNNRRAQTYRKLHDIPDGVWQPWPNQRHGRGFHAQSLYGRERDLRRIFDQCAGRGCSVWYSYAAVSDAKGARGSGHA